MTFLRLQGSFWFHISTFRAFIPESITFSSALSATLQEKPVTAQSFSVPSWEILASPELCHKPHSAITGIVSQARSTALACIWVNNLQMKYSPATRL